MVLVAHIVRGRLTIDLLSPSVAPLPMGFQNSALRSEVDLLGMVRLCGCEELLPVDTLGPQ